jgi:hypothetical protein
LHYFTKLYVFYKIKFPKIMSETQVSFVNEASAGNFPLGLILHGEFLDGRVLSFARLQI